MSSDISKRTYNGIVFDSVLEMKFFRDVVLPGMGSGQFVSYELQKSYELQPKFTYQGKTIRPITYVADFVLELPDGHKYVIDTKGMPDSTAKLKAKLFHYKFPNIDYYWVSYSKIDGGWVTYEKLKAARANRKKLKSGGKC